MHRLSRPARFRNARAASVDLGLRHITKDELLAARAVGQRLDIRVLGLAVIAADVTADLARETISALTVLGTLQASDAAATALIADVYPEVFSAAGVHSGHPARTAAAAADRQRDGGAQVSPDQPHRAGWAQHG